MWIQTYQASIIINTLYKCDFFFFLVNTWSDVIVVEEGTAVTLNCSEEPPISPRQVSWLMMPAKGQPWTMLISVNVSTGRVDGRQMVCKAGRILGISDNIFLRFIATMESGGLYSCLLEKEDRKFKERIVLLAVIKCWVVPSVFISVMHTTLNFSLSVSPSYLFLLVVL